MSQQKEELEDGKDLEVAGIIFSNGEYYIKPEYIPELGAKPLRIRQSDSVRNWKRRRARAAHQAGEKDETPQETSGCQNSVS